MTLADAVADANDGRISLWHPHDGGTDRHSRTIDDYRSELSELLSVPVRSESVRTDGGPPSLPDLLVRAGPDHRLRDVLFDDRPMVPNPDCTTVTVYPPATRRLPLGRRLLERLVF